MPEKNLLPYKLLFFGSLVFILLTIGLSVFLKNSSFEFASLTLRNSAPFIAAFGLPIAIMFLLSFRHLYSKKRTSIDELPLNALTFLVAVCTFFAVLFHVVLNMCSTHYSDAMYTHHQDADRIVVESSFGCGATDSGPASIHLKEINNYFWLFQTVNRIDSIELKEPTWIVVKKD